ncbi:response regulator [Qipengyuania spongiae]|uniref:Response regulator n=1 Tax=Qipengyuania spongiae TaxID=2909673 RepID=A0ABY5SUS6_9SPHN|nr:response regulator [Qipengyuania spongiae]UVI38080.1 response regulator [Qipengyuania spongiae]
MKTFLVLEDEPLIAMDLKYAFEDLDLHAVSASDNQEALACIEKHAISGAILDVSLGGGETCQPTANELTRRAIPFLLHTGDLDRVGERLRDIDAPVVAKPRASDDVVKRLLAMID